MLKESIPPVLILAVIIGLYGATYGGVMATWNSETKNTVKNRIAIITGTNFVLILILTALSNVYITMNPHMYNMYVIIMIHLTLFLSLLSVSLSMLDITTNQ
jgi:Kef-type K+ transport system membrane component KefB